MYTSSVLSGAAALLALAPSVLAVGSASVINGCSTAVYYKVISTSEEAYQLIPSGGVHETYSLSGVGVSIKLATSNSASAPVSQFEYTWADGKVAYDLSNINGYPFSAGGITINPSASNSSADPTCVPVNCPAGTTTCTAAYNAPDDTDTLVCADSTSLTLTLCPGGGAAKRDTVHKYNTRSLHRPRHPHARV